MNYILENNLNMRLITTLPTPVFNTPYIKAIFGGADGSTLKTDSKGHIRELEFIALNNTECIAKEKIIIKNQAVVYKVSFDFYPSQNIFLDERFVKPLYNKGSIQQEFITNPKKIIQNLEDSLGYPYLWGGNYKKGISQMRKFFPLKDNNKDESFIDKWNLVGIDCSGLLFEATNGFTPRNTSLLMNFGKFINIEGKNSCDICKIVKPLDIIVFPGHVIIIKNKKYSIESRENFGCVQTPLKNRLQELFNIKEPLNSPSSSSSFFVIKRWI